jgi:hypothetical protein
MCFSGSKERKLIRATIDGDDFSDDDLSDPDETAVEGISDTLKLIQIHEAAKVTKSRIGDAAEAF